MNAVDLTAALITDWTKVPVERIAEGTERQIIVGQNLMLCRFRRTPFVVTAERSHPHE